MRFKDLITTALFYQFQDNFNIYIPFINTYSFKYAGPENYGNYIIFHFILMFSINLNFGIGKSTV